MTAAAENTPVEAAADDPADDDDGYHADEDDDPAETVDCWPTPIEDIPANEDNVEELPKSGAFPELEDPTAVETLE
ncbi:hypothetical protein HDU93_007109 [Gonapodya sp. JEL0774]|nr:hypothetical protein HDU93_007109 [Gonapodya sp. JEL0774]